MVKDMIEIGNKESIARQVAELETMVISQEDFSSLADFTTRKNPQRKVVGALWKRNMYWSIHDSEELWIIGTYIGSGKEQHPKLKYYRPLIINKTITLCGSTRFKKAFMEWNARFTLDGHLIYSVAFWSHADRIDPKPEEKKLLDEVHMRKIEKSDEIFVLDVDGYIGESTQNKINHAVSLGKKVRYLSKEHPNWTEEDCIYVKEK